MIKVFIKKQGHFPVSSTKIKKALSAFFLEKGVVSDADVNIAIVGKEEMLRIGKKYLSPREPLHNVLSFVPGEAKEPFVESPGSVLHLGDIAVCYPVAAKEAGEEGVFVEEKVIELLIHGSYHLLGIHHE